MPLGRGCDAELAVEGGTCKGRRAKNAPNRQGEAAGCALALSEQEGALRRAVEQRLLRSHTLDLPVEPTGERRCSWMWCARVSFRQGTRVGAQTFLSMSTEAPERTSASEREVVCKMSWDEITQRTRAVPSLHSLPG